MIWVALLGAAQTLFAGVPDGYYSRIDGEKKADLKSAVKACASEGKYRFSYGDLWEEYPYTDFVIGTENQVFDYYSTEIFHFPYKNGQPTGGIPSGMNKEHACPQSWWGKGAKSDCYSDLFNVMPSESNANSSKSNYPVGIVDTGKEDFDNGRIKTGSSATDNFRGKVFEPADEHKGDFARIYFYVATMYDKADWQTDNTAFNKESYPTVKSNFIQLLLKWHREDPVSNWEIVRNERVFGRQKNRNPYIDYPQLVEYIWGDSTEYAFDLSAAKVNGYGARQDTIVPDPPVPDPPVPPFQDSTLVFEETFASVTLGDNTTNSGSNQPWAGDDNFTKVETIYQAGHAVRFGSSKKAGSLTSVPIVVREGLANVILRIKGWNNHGSIKVQMDNQSQTVRFNNGYMSNDFETIEAKFSGLPSSSVLTISSGSPNRCFIELIQVYTAAVTGIETVETDHSESTSSTIDLLGRPYAPNQRGLHIQRGKIVLVR